MTRPPHHDFSPSHPGIHKVKACSIWSSPAGKARLAPLLARLLPLHKVYVEPFAGSGAVLLAKDRSEIEGVNDLDPDIAHAFRLVSRLNVRTRQYLLAQNWTGSKQIYDALRAATMGKGIQRFHRFLYLNRFGVGAIRESGLFDLRKEGRVLNVGGYLDRHAPRLAGVIVREGDFEPVVNEFDGLNTVFFFDPPYAGYKAGVGEGSFDERRFFKLLINLKGKFLLTYGIRGRLPSLVASWGFPIVRIKPSRELRSVNHKGPRVLTQLVVTNYALPEFRRLRRLHLQGALG